MPNHPVPPVNVNVTDSFKSDIGMNILYDESNNAAVFTLSYGTGPIVTFTFIAQGPAFREIRTAVNALTYYVHG